jgi:hypothetical protein
MRSKKHLILAAIMAGYMIFAPLCFAQEPKANPPVPCAILDVDKPHSACPDSQCWTVCTDPGYENTSTQAASVNVIYSQCCFCCGLNPDLLYQDMVDSTGNVGQYPEEESLSIINWVANHCSACTLQIAIAHKGYPGHDPVNPQNVSFIWAYQQTVFTKDVKIWVVSQAQLPLPPAPTSKQDLSQELTYRGGGSSVAFVYDPDCDINGMNANRYQIGSDANGEYLQDYFGVGNHGYLHGVISISGPICCSHACPSLSQLGIIILIILIIGTTVLIILRRREVAVPE